MGSGENLENISKKQKFMNSIYTIGHSNHTAEIFLSLLQAGGIQVVVDVRTAPYSRYVPRFNKLEIERTLVRAGFKYLYLGDMIGGKPTDSAFHDQDGKVNYRKLAASRKFQAGIDRLVKGLGHVRLVLMCAEEDPRHCHRHLLIARELELGRQIAVNHLRADGSSLRALDLLGSTPRQMELFNQG